MKREFNENQRADLKYRADKGIDEAEYFFALFHGWIRNHEKALSYAFGKYTIEYFDEYAKSYFIGLPNNSASYKGLAGVLDDSKNDIYSIFEAAQQVENEYAKKFGDIAFEMNLYADRINALCGVLKNPGGAVTSAFDLPVIDFQSKLNAAIYAQNEQEAAKLAAFYLEDGKWKGYIEAQMNKDQKDISYAEYLGMILIFEGLKSIKDKEKFIETAYRALPAYSSLDGTYPPAGGLTGDRIAGETQYRTYYELNPVFAVMAEISKQKMNEIGVSNDDLKDLNSDFHNKLFSSQLLTGIANYGGTLFFNPYTSNTSGEFKVEIKAYEGSDRAIIWPYDYTVGISGYTNMADILRNNPTDRQKEASFTVFQFRESNIVNNTIMKDCVSSTAISIIPKVDIGAAVSQTLTGLIPYRHIGDVASIVFTGGNITQAYEDVRAAEAKVAQINESLDYGNLSTAAYFGSALTVLPDGSFEPNYIMFNKPALEERLAKYKVETGVSLAIEDIISKIIDGNIYDEDLRDYVKWRINESNN